MPLNFYFWDYLQQTVYLKPIKNLNHLRQIITEEIQLIEPDIFSFHKKRHTLDIENNGHHIEQLL